MTPSRDAGPWTRARLREEEAKHGAQSGVLFLPGPDREINPEGCVVVKEEDGRVKVYVLDRGIRHVRWFEDEAAAIEYVIRRYVWWEDV
ncbi:MAG: hypothetical protein V9F04_06545 [Dermatophilaceae bacterium]